MLLGTTTKSGVNIIQDLQPAPQAVVRRLTSKPPTRRRVQADEQNKLLSVRLWENVSMRRFCFLDPRSRFGLLVPHRRLQADLFFPAGTVTHNGMSVQPISGWHASAAHFPPGPVTCPWTLILSPTADVGSNTNTKHCCPVHWIKVIHYCLVVRQIRRDQITSSTTLFHK